VLLLLGLILCFNPSSWFCWMFSSVWVVLCKNLWCSWWCFLLVEWELLLLVMLI
jgi:hypothetical protein